MIFTTYGYLPEDQVELRPTATEDEDKIVTRTDKYIKSTGEWVGNDLHVHLKKPLSLEVVQGQFS